MLVQDPGSCAQPSRPQPLSLQAQPLWFTSPPPPFPTTTRIMQPSISMYWHYSARPTGPPDILHLAPHTTPTPRTPAPSALPSLAGGLVVQRFGFRLERQLEMADDVLCVRVSPDGKLLAASLLDHTIKVYYLDRWACMCVFGGGYAGAWGWIHQH